MTTELTPVELALDRPGPLQRAWAQPLWVHAAALALIVVALLPLMSPRSSFTSDEGAYALQVKALEQGGWEYDWKAAPLDPGGEAVPFVNSVRDGDRFFPYIQHPAWPLLLRGASAVAGTTVGLHLLALLGTVGTAVAAWLLAGEVDPRLRRPAFWMAATGPVLANGYLLWAHSASAAVAGLALVAAVHLVRRGPSPAWVAAGAAGLAAGVLLRSEALLFAAAVGVVLAAALLPRHGRLGRALATAAHVAGPSVLVAVGERAWVRAISGGARENLYARSGEDPWLSGRLAAANHDLLAGGMGNVWGASLDLLALALLAVLAVLALRRWRTASVPLLRLTLVVALVPLAIRLAAHPARPVTGLLAAWPLAVVGLAVVPRFRDAGLKALVAVVALTAAAVLLTSYPEGGGVQWGGRFLSPLLAPLAVVIVASLDHRLRAAPQAARRWTAGVLATVAVVGAVAALISVGTLRARHQRMIDAVARHPATVTVTTLPAFPRLSWSVDDQVTWMLTDPDHLPDVLADLRRQGVGSVAVLVDDVRTNPDSFTGWTSIREVVEPALRRSHYRLYQLSA